MPPGKNESGLDFCYFHGLYRDVWIHITDPLHVTDAIYANKVADGGVFVRYSNVSPSSAMVNVKTNVKNDSEMSTGCVMKTSIVDKNNTIVASHTSNTATIGPGGDNTFTQNLTVSNPNLWSPDNPYMYTVYTSVSKDGIYVDDYKTRIGIRTINFTHNGGFTINGTRIKFMGANRHQNYPYVGNAFSNNGQYRDAFLMKEAGFQYVRTSHYPQDTAFLDACDELGIMVMNSMPGWQYWNSGSTFRNRCYQVIRDMIRRDRNHPSIIVWEASLNESGYDTTFANDADNIVHEEYPGNAFSAGWRYESYYDVFTSSAQHNIRDYTGSKPVIIAEHGQWEYGGHSSSSHVDRGASESDLLQQAWNHQESLHLNRGLSWLSGDGLWVFNDYNRGYRNDMCLAGVVDIFRLPKYSYYFFQSQRDPNHIISGVDSGPMVFIASKWQSGTNQVKVFSNCDQVALYINDSLTATRGPDTGTNTGNLLHPPFTFPVSFQSGKLEARGIIGGTERANHTIYTPGSPDHITVEIDTCGITPVADGSDIVMVYAYIRSSNGNVVSTAMNNISFSVNGEGSILGSSTINAGAGIAGALLQTTRTAGSITVTASAAGLNPGSAQVTSITMTDEYPSEPIDVTPTPTSTPGTPTPIPDPTSTPDPNAGSILREYWTGISANSISDLTNNANYPDNPSGSDYITSFEIPENWGDNYGTRVRGYLHPEANRDYIFWIAGDNNCELWLSTDETEANKVLIASVPDWTNPKEWYKYPDQESDPIFLLEGNKYYIEALHIERTGGDHLAVAWENSGLIVEVIPGNCLSPVDLSQPGITGDVNNDGSVDIIDALLTAQYYVGLNPAGFNPENADVNMDGSIDIIDALMIAQFYVGLLPSL